MAQCLLILTQDKLFCAQSLNPEQIEYLKSTAGAKLQLLCSLLSYLSIYSFISIGLYVCLSHKYWVFQNELRQRIQDFTLFPSQEVGHYLSYPQTIRNDFRNPLLFVYAILLDKMSISTVQSLCCFMSLFNQKGQTHHYISIECQPCGHIL